MKLICDANSLNDAVLKVSKALPLKPVNATLDGIKITAKDDTITLFATDLELAIEKSISADVLLEGEVVVPGKLFSEFVKKLTDQQVELTLDNSQLKIKYTDSQTVIQCLNIDEYPAYERLQNAEKFCMMQQELKELINKTIFAVSKDDARPVLKGCLLEIDQYTISCIALDGYRMAKVDKPLEQQSNSMTAIVPSRAMSELSKLLEQDELVTIHLEKNYLLAELGSITLSTRLLNGQYVTYRQIIPTESTTNVVVNKQTFKNALDRASLLSKSEKTNLVKMDMREGVMHLTSNSQMGNVDEHISISLKGKDCTIAFNATYLIDCINVITSEFIMLSMTNNLSPALIRECDNQSALYLVLPIRITNIDN